MKKILLFFISSLTWTSITAQTPEDEKKVLEVFEKMGKAWSVGDYGYTQYDILDSNAVLVNPVGMYWKNSTEIRNGLEYLGKVRFQYLTFVDGSITSMRFLSPTSVLVVASGTDEVTQDFKMPGESTINKKGERSKGIQSYTLIKKNNEWIITSMTVTHVVANNVQK